MELRFDTLLKNSFSPNEWDHLLYDDEFCCMVEQVRTKEDYMNTVAIGCQILEIERDIDGLGQNVANN